MKTIQQIRINNLRQLINENDTAQAVADLSGTSAVYLSQILSNSDTAQNRNIGTRLARKLEEGCGKTIGWMDVEHHADKNETELIRIYSMLNPKMRKMLLAHAKQIATQKGE